MDKVRIFRKYKDTYAALKHLLLGAVDNNYAVNLKHAKLGYANITTRDILSHLCGQYGVINT